MSRAISQRAKKEDTGWDEGLCDLDDGEVFSNVDGAPSSNLTTGRTGYGNAARTLHVTSRQGRAMARPGRNQVPPPVLRSRRGQEDDTAGAEAPPNKPPHYQTARLRHQDPHVARATYGDDMAPNVYVASREDNAKSQGDVIGAEAPPIQPRPYHQEAIVGALAIHGDNYTADDDRTVQIGGDESACPQDPSITPITTTAKAVDMEEELRIRQENERYRHMFEDVAMAQAVTEPEHETEQEPKNCPRCNKRWVFVLSALLLLAVIVVGIVFGLGVNSSGEATTASVEPTQSPTMAPPPPTVTPPPTPPQDLVDLLSSVSSDGGTALLTPETPQNDALEWLAGNSNLNTYSDDKKKQRYALAVLYYSTQGDLSAGDTWYRREHWLDDGEECGRWWQGSTGPSTTWSTLICTDSGSVSELHLNGNNLRGTLQPEIELLSDSLEILYLYYNKLSGPVPSQVGKLSNLVDLWLHWNSLSGTVPSQFGNLTKLTNLQLDSNKLTGTIPASLERLTNLVSLSLGKNQLTGKIPNVFESLTNLETLGLFENNFTGAFTCPDFITTCYISCEDDTDECRSL